MVLSTEEISCRGIKMKNTGITRKIDDLGRIVIPIELREKLGIKKQDQLEIFISDNQIILMKEEKSCIFCESKKMLSKVKDRHVCENCINEMNHI